MKAPAAGWIACSLAFVGIAAIAWPARSQPRARSAMRARRLVADLAVQCGDCHEDSADISRFVGESEPFDDGSAASRMARHERAAGAVWLGRVDRLATSGATGSSHSPRRPSPTCSASAPAVTSSPAEGHPSSRARRRSISSGGRAPTIRSTSLPPRRRTMVGIDRTR